MKKLCIYTLLILLVVGVVGRLALEFPSIQKSALLRAASANMTRTPNIREDTLHVFMCGTSSPLAAAGTAQACIAILTPDHFYIVDSGAGSTANLQADNLPMSRLQAVLITHFHSDHIAELGELNLVSWVQGRPEPLQIIGPEGVDKLVDGTNMAYTMSRSYRVAHHGELLKPSVGVLASKTIGLGDKIVDGDLTIETFVTDHAPISPSLGYKFTYKGRSVVITGDTLLTDEWKAASQGVDLVLADALSLPVVKTLEEAAASVGDTRMSQIFFDIQNYHASVADVVQFNEEVDVKMTALYHMVPAPTNFLMRLMYDSELDGGVTLTQDRQWFVLPANSDDIIVVGN